MTPEIITATSSLGGGVVVALVFMWLFSKVIFPSLMKSHDADRAAFLIAIENIRVVCDGIRDIKGDTEVIKNKVVGG